MRAAAPPFSVVFFLVAAANLPGSDALAPTARQQQELQHAALHLRAGAAPTLIQLPQRSQPRSDPMGAARDGASYGSSFPPGNAAPPFADHRLLKQVLRDGPVWVLVLAGIGLSLAAYAGNHPQSRLAGHASGFHRTPIYSYVNSVLVCAIGLPLFSMVAVAERDPAAPWWFGSQPQWALGEGLALVSAYWIQDLILYFNDLSTLVAVHHSCCAACVLVLCLGRSWWGISLTALMLGELGSNATACSDLGLWPQRPAWWFFGLMTVLPMIFVTYGLVASPPRELSTVVVAVLTLVLCAARLNYARASLGALNAGRPASRAASG